MIRKLMTSILCLLLALALPMGALAATEATLTIVPGDEMAKVTVIKELLDTVQLQFVGDAENKSGAFSLIMGGDKVLTLATRINADGLYAESAVLGDKPLFFDWESLSKLIETMLKEAGVDGSKIVEAFNQIPVKLSAGSAEIAAQATAADKEQAIQKLIEQFQNDEVLVELINDITARVVTTEGEYTSEKHDAAAFKTELALTSADYVKAMDSKLVRDSMSKVIDQQYASLSADEKAAKLDELIAQTKKIYTDLNMSALITVFAGKEEALPAAMTVEIIADGFVESKKTVDGVESTVNTPVKLDAPMNYNRLTTEAGVRHSGDMTFNFNDKIEALVNARLDSNTDGTSNGALGMLVAEQEINLTYGKVTSGDVKNREIALYMRSGATSLLEPAHSDRPLVTIKLETKPADEATLAAVNGASPDASAKLLSMQEDEMSAYVTDLSTRAMQVLYTVLGKLPPSAIELMGPLLNGK